MDKITKEQRSHVMSSIKSRNTLPELAVRRALRRLGVVGWTPYGDLPGHPDIVISGRRVAIFVHGCFWHQHKGCKKAKIPGTRVEYWAPKLARNAERDAEQRAALEGMGWRVVEVWECEIKDDEQLAELLAAKLK